MAWTEITRPQYRRDHLRYASDATDEEWKVIAPHLPPSADCGRTRETDLREVVNAIFYIAPTSLVPVGLDQGRGDRSQPKPLPHGVGRNPEPGRDVLDANPALVQGSERLELVRRVHVLPHRVLRQARLGPAHALVVQHPAGN